MMDSNKGCIIIGISIEIRRSNGKCQESYSTYNHPRVIIELFGGNLSVNLNTYLGSGREIKKHLSTLKIWHEIHAVEFMHFPHMWVP